MNKTNKKYLILLLAFFLSAVVYSCIEDEERDAAFGGVLMGYSPLYASAEEAEVKMLPSRSLDKPGKIYVFGDWLFVNERMKGVHIINNKNPENPINTAFLQVAGNIDMALKDGVLFLDQSGSLITVNISNPEQIILGERIENVFQTEFAYPPERGVYFECVDRRKGIVIGWEWKELENPKCYR